MYVSESFFKDEFQYVELGICGVDFLCWELDCGKGGVYYVFGYEFNNYEWVRVRYIVYVVNKVLDVDGNCEIYVDKEEVFIIINKDVELNEIYYKRLVKFLKER